MGLVYVPESVSESVLNILAIKRLKEEENLCNELGDGSVTINEGNGRVNMENDGGTGDKRSWMNTVQLWNSDFDNLD
ncbi:hypothetical protein GOBAR_DD19077 [Gossypium barbadense]|nr:hypothetical protein GOBAR_DD19077 [Gossypium barbadense]